MTTAIRRRRGTTTQHATFTGLEGEVTVDTTKETLVVHDGATAGGFPLLREDLSNNSNVATLNGIQTLSGAKTFSAAATFSAGSAAAPAITTTGDSNTGIFFPAADTIAFSEGGVESMRLDSSGNLGLGVTPSAWRSNYRAIQIGQGAAYWAQTDAPSALISSNAFLDSGLAWRYLTTNPASYYGLYNGGHQWFTAPSGTAGNAISFTQAMTLNSSGTFLVGLTDNNNYAKICTTSLGVYEGNDAADGGLYLQKQSGAPTRLGSIRSYGANSGLTLWTNSGGTDYERARIDASGNFGLGVTPSAWDRPAYQSTQNLAVLGLSNTSNLAQNAYFNAGWKYMTSAAAADFQVAQGAFYWFTAPSGTAGNAISFTQAMTLDASGNLGVGTTSPATRVHADNGANATFLRATSTQNTAGFDFGVGGSGDSTAYVFNRNNTPIVFATNATERARIDSSGNFIKSVPTTPPTLSTNGTMVFNLTSNTNLRISVRGSDGVTRTANITLA